MGRRRDRARQRSRAEVRAELRDAAIDEQTEASGFMRANLAWIVGAWVTAAASGSAAFVLFGLIPERPGHSTERSLFFAAAVLAAFAFAWPLRRYMEWNRGIEAREALDARVVASEVEAGVAFDFEEARERAEVEVKGS